MDNREAFKSFVRKNPTFANFIKDGSMTWQKFYEMYDLYGENDGVWDKYLVSDTKKDNTLKDITKTSAFTDFIAFLKTINLDSLQEGIGSIQRVLGVFQDFSGNKDNVDNTDKKE